MRIEHWELSIGQIPGRTQYCAPSPLMTRPLRRLSSCSLYDDKADVIGEVSEMEKVFLNGFENLSGSQALDLANFMFQPLGDVGFIASGVVQESIRVKQQYIALAHQPPFVQLILILESQNALRSAAVDDVLRRKHSNRRERRAQVLANFHKAVMFVGKDNGRRMCGRQKAKCRVFGYFTIDHRHKFVQVRQIVEARVHVLE